MAGQWLTASNLPRDAPLSGLASAPRRPSGGGLELFKLAAHLIDRLIELLHPIAERRVETLRRCVDRLDRRFTRLHQTHQLAAGLAPAIRLGEKPPGQTRGTNQGAGGGAGQDGAAAAGPAGGMEAWFGLGFRHGMGVGKGDPWEGDSQPKDAGLRVP